MKIYCADSDYYESNSEVGFWNDDVNWYKLKFEDQYTHILLHNDLYLISKFGPTEIFLKDYFQEDCD